MKTYPLFFFVVLSVCYHASGQNTKAIQAYDQVRNSLIEKKFYDAVFYANQYIESNPGDPYMYYNRAMAKWQLGDMPATMHDLHQAKSLGLNISSNQYLDAMMNKGKMIRLLAGGYITDVKLDSLNGFKPFYTIRDTLRGALRPERTCFDVYFYDLTVKIDPEEKTIYGYNTIYFRVLDTTNKIQIDLTEKLSVHSILFKDIPLEYERLYDAIFIHLPKQLLPGDTSKIKITYGGEPLVAVDPPWNGGFVWEKKKGKPWIGVACEHLGASTWWPNKDHLSDKPDSMTINVQVPSDLKAISNGNLIKSWGVDDNYINYQWFVSYPINNYNVTFYAGDFVNIHEEHKNRNGTCDIDYYVLPHSTKKADDYYRQTKEIVRVYEELFGYYPFHRDGLAFVESPYSGMEHQSAIAIGDEYNFDDRSYYGDKDFDYLLVHETAHEWWGNALAIGDMADAWINEAFATYSEHLFMEKMYGYPEYINASAVTMGMIFNLFPVVGNRDVNDNTFLTNDIYHKGAAMLNNLRCIINNDSLFFSILKDFYNTFKFKIACTDDFISFVTERTNQDYSDFFKKFLYDDQPPELEYAFSIVNNTLSLNYRWVGVGKNFTMPFSVTINNDTNIRLVATTKPQVFRFEGVESVFLPNQYYFQKNNITRNSFTYYQTYWEEERIVIQYNDDRSWGKGKTTFGMRQGEWTEYHPNGKKKMVAVYLDDEFHGKAETFDEEGKLTGKYHFRHGLPDRKVVEYSGNITILEGEYQNGVKTGQWKYYYPNGVMEAEGNYNDGKEAGKWIHYNSNAKIAAKGEFLDGVPVKGSWLYFDTNGNLMENPDTLRIVDSPPCFRGGEIALFNFIKENLVLSIEQQKSAAPEKIYISFLINPNGSLSDFRIEKSYSDDLANALIDVFKQMPNWKPGYSQGNPVYVRYFFPFAFTVKKV